MPARDLWGSPSRHRASWALSWALSIHSDRSSARRLSRRVPHRFPARHRQGGPEPFAQGSEDSPMGPPPPPEIPSPTVSGTYSRQLSRGLSPILFRDSLGRFPQCGPVTLRCHSDAVPIPSRGSSRKHPASSPARSQGGPGRFSGNDRRVKAAVLFGEGRGWRSWRGAGCPFRGWAWGPSRGAWPGPGPGSPGISSPDEKREGTHGLLAITPRTSSSRGGEVSRLMAINSPYAPPHPREPPEPPSSHPWFPSKSRRPPPRPCQSAPKRSRTSRFTPEATPGDPRFHRRATPGPTRCHGPGPPPGRPVHLRPAFASACGFPLGRPRSRVPSRTYLRHSIGTCGTASVPLRGPPVAPAGNSLQPLWVPRTPRGAS